MSRMYATAVGSALADRDDTDVDFVGGIPAVWIQRPV
jgi:hypothetical protein